MIEKKKNQQSPNTLAFILFWVIVVGLTQSQILDYSEIWRGAYEIVMKLPQVLHRLWVAYLLHGVAAGLAVGLAQKFAIQTLRPMQLKYWVRASVVIAVIAKMVDYSLMRWVYSSSVFPPLPPEAYSVTPYIGQLLLLVVPWWFLRKQFKHAWLWLLLAIPNLALASSMSLYPFIPYLQALIGACVLLWLNHQTPAFGKLKHGAKADERLLDMIPDDEEDEAAESDAPMVSFQARR